MWVLLVVPIYVCVQPGLWWYVPSPTVVHTYRLVLDPVTARLPSLVCQWLVCLFSLLLFWVWVVYDLWRYFLHWPRDPTLLAIPHLVPESGVLLLELCVAGCNTGRRSKSVCMRAVFRSGVESWITKVLLPGTVSSKQFFIKQWLWKGPLDTESYQPSCAKSRMSS